MNKKIRVYTLNQEGFIQSVYFIFTGHMTLQVPIRNIAFLSRTQKEELYSKIMDQIDVFKECGFEVEGCDSLLPLKPIKEE